MMILNTLCYGFGDAEFIMGGIKRQEKQILQIIKLFQADLSIRYWINFSIFI